MEFRDLKRQYSILKDELDKAMTQTAAAGAYIGGAPVKELEQRLAEYVGVRHCISCANGTDALTIALKVWGIGPGDAVFVPDFTFFSSAETVAAEGAVPVFVDVDAATFNIDPEDLERRIRAVETDGRLRPRVIVAVDLFGLPANYRRIREIASRHGLLVLEDGAQGFGGAIRCPDSACRTGSSDSKPAGLRRACSFGDIATTSFFPAKPLGCYGDGGAIFTDNDEWAALAESLKVHGKGTFKYDNVRIGMNSRLDTLQAAILLVKFRAFAETELDGVNRVAKEYSEKLGSLAASCGCCMNGDEGIKSDCNAAGSGKIILPTVPEGFLSSWAQYTIRLGSREDRDGLQAFLKARGIPSMVYYPTGMHAQTAFAGLGYRRDDGLDGDSGSRTTNNLEKSFVNGCDSGDRHDGGLWLDYGFTVSDKLCQTVLSLPMHPYMTSDEIDEVCSAIGEWLAARKTERQDVH